MISKALNKTAKAAVSVFNVDGVCYAVRLLRVDKLMFCLRHGIIMLGTESVISKAIKLRACSLRKVVMCLLNECTLWLTRVLRFDYTYYLRTKVLSLRLLTAKRVLLVMSSSLLLCSICANLTLLACSVFCTRYHSAFCRNSICFVKKIM